MTEHAAPGRPGDPDVRLLICTPTGAPGPRPAIYYSFGGGMFSGDHRHRPNVDPLLDIAPLDDLRTGLLWTADHAADLGIDPQRIIIAGTSAGGALTAALALTVRDQGGPRLLGQLLMSPMLDDRNDSPSMHRMEGIDIWDRTTNGFGWSALLGSTCGAPDVSPYAAPARATDLSGLPPTYLDTGSAESLRDEITDYATRIWAASGAAELHIWSGGFHCFDKVVPESRVSRAAVEARHAWIGRLLAG
ncbi:acetyl esterase/lipase [Catenulispora sp. GP43]|uniref:alpha/beta hydrolase n=1 Tax=Catenulispora sp. GP43 TaxID=3156263 RepID=UPI003516A2A7